MLAIRVVILKIQMPWAGSADTACASEVWFTQNA